MAKIEIIPGSHGFVRPGGRDGGFLPRDRWQDADDNVISPYDFVLVPGRDAEMALADLKRSHPRSTPILMGTVYEAAMLYERMRNWEKAPREWLAQADDFDLDVWLVERKRFHEEHCARYGQVWPKRGPWPGTVRKFDRLLVPDEVLRPDEKKPLVVICLLPTADPTEAAAYFSFGGWNDCPKPPVHICLARRWHERYGAVLQSNTYDIVEFSVAQPLKDRQKALQLAWDQFHYCTDSVPETLEVAAAELIGATVWNFWWD